MTFEPNGELDRIVAESLRDRAARASVQGCGLGDVRRRVRRRRQRQMAVGLVPAMAGLGWVVTRPATHTPLTPGGDAAPCGKIPTSTWFPGSYPATTAPPPWTGSSTTWYTGADGNPTGTMFVSDVTVTTITFSQHADGNWYDSEGRLVDSNGNPLWSTTTPSGPSTTDPYGNVITVPYTTLGYPVGSTTTLPADFPLLIVNASHYGTAEEAATFIYSGVRTATATSTVAESVVLTRDDPNGLAATVARDLGIVDPTTGAPNVKVGLDSSMLPAGTDLSGINVIVLIGDDVAAGLVGPTPTTLGMSGDSTTTSTICEPSSTDVTPTTNSSDSTTTTSILGDFTSTKVQVANCSVQSGVAQMMSSVLTDTGFTMADPVNGTCDPKLDTSYVIYDTQVSGAKEVADTLARVLGGLHMEPTTQLPIKVESGAWADGSGVVLLLGNDLAGKTLDQIHGESVSGTTAPTTTFVDTATTNS
jgi:hypothetical protein